MTKALIEFIEKHPGVRITEELDSLCRAIRFTMELGKHRISRLLSIEEIESIKDDSILIDRWFTKTLEQDYMELMERTSWGKTVRSIRGGRLNEN